MLFSGTFVASILSVLLALTAHAAPVQPGGSLAKRNGTTPVFVGSLDQCPPISPRSSPPASVHDLRPDDFSYTLALGDSITAGCFAQGIQENPLLNLGEWRGDSYAAGANPGAITVPNLIKHYKPSITGGSTGYNIVPEICFGPLCPIGPFGWSSEVDQLNAAQSGALASNLYHEVVDYLVPQVKQRNIPKTSFKYLNLQIGSNDICSLCVQSTIGVGPGSPDDFEMNIRKALEAVRSGIPNTVVNLFGAFRVSDVYTLTLNQPYCSQLVPVPHANIECPCMLLGGDVGNATRAAMDSLQDQYNDRLIKIAKDYQTLHYADFAVLWQPANVPLSSYPVYALSDVDCFHPSIKTHQLIASYIWNKLPGGAEDKAEALSWSENLLFRCLQDDDRIQTSTLV